MKCKDLKGFPKEKEITGKTCTDFYTWGANEKLKEIGELEIPSKDYDEGYADGFVKGQLSGLNTANMIFKSTIGRVQ